jgi:nicotinamide riboside kinase
VWSEHKYGQCDTFILEEIARRSYDFYLLTDIDMVWTDDPLREHPQPEMRRYFFRVYQDIVQNSGRPWSLIKGKPESRLEQAKAALSSLL